MAMFRTIIMESTPMIRPNTNVGSVIELVPTSTS